MMGGMLKPALHSLFSDYEASHQHPTNRLTHKVAIPLIVFHSVAMLDWVPLLTIPGTAFTITLAHLVFLAAMGWYLAMNVKLGLLMVLFYGVCFPIGWMTPRPLVVAIAVVGWLVQLAGHAVWEKKSPAFLRNMLQALVGPLFFVALLTGDWKLGVSAGQTQEPARATA
jgi:uncharacterized membrane protein YGL010W